MPGRHFLQRQVEAECFACAEVSAALLIVLAAAASAPAQAQTRKPTAREIAAIRDCAKKTKDDVDAGEGRCLFKLVADPCMAPVGAAPEGSWPTAFRSKG